jgi:hypothetical protein
MVATARRLLARVGLEERVPPVEVGDPLAGLGFPDRQFDLVLAAHVVHGLRPAGRRRFYREALRVCRGPLLLFEFAPRSLPSPGLVARVLEALERSDYRRFRRDGLRELGEVFSEVEVIPAGPGTAWYLCRERS